MTLVPENQVYLLQPNTLISSSGANDADDASAGPSPVVIIVCGRYVLSVFCCYVVIVVDCFCFCYLLLLLLSSSSSLLVVAYSCRYCSTRALVFVIGFYVWLLLFVFC